MKKENIGIAASLLAGTISGILFLSACQPTTIVNAPGNSTDQSNSESAPNFNNRTLKQVDRLALPSLNIVLNGYNGFTKPVYDSLKMTKEMRDSAKDKYNSESPASDMSNYRDFWSTALQGVFKRSKSDADGIATALSPDVYTIDINKQTSFANLNGRMLSDDVIDTELKLLSGNKDATDGVSTNDKSFMNSFPYLAKPF